MESSRVLINNVNERLNHPRVHLIENVPQPIKSALLEEAQVLCLPSRRESLGGVYIESMASGTPVIALDRPVSHCVIDHAENGLLVSEDVDSIIDGLQILLNDSTLRQTMAQSGIEKVNSLYTWEIVTRKIIAAYELVNRKYSAGVDKAA